MIWKNTYRVKECALQGGRLSDPQRQEEQSPVTVEEQSNARTISRESPENGDGVNKDFFVRLF